MPIQRINDQGEIVPDKAEVLLEENRQRSERKQKRVKILSLAITAGTLAGAAVFHFASENLGLLVAVAFANAASAVNLYLD